MRHWVKCYFLLKHLCMEEKKIKNCTSHGDSERYLLTSRRRKKPRNSVILIDAGGHCGGKDTFHTRARFFPEGAGTRVYYYIILLCVKHSQRGKVVLIRKQISVYPRRYWIVGQQSENKHRVGVKRFWRILITKRDPVKRGKRTHSFSSEPSGRNDSGAIAVIRLSATFLQVYMYRCARRTHYDDVFL